MRDIPNADQVSNEHLDDNYPKTAEHESEEDIACYQRIAPAPEKQPAPGDDAMGPASPDIGFQSQVDESKQYAPEKSRAYRHQQAADGPNRHREMGAKDPERNLHRDDEKRKTKRPLGVAPSRLVIAIGEENC